MQQPILSGLGGSLEIYAQPKELYRRAARRTLEQIGKDNAVLSAAIETLLLWRDNSWAVLEDQVVTMLESATSGCTIFVLDRDLDGTRCGKLLERPFVHQVRDHLTAVSLLFGLGLLGHSRRRTPLLLWRAEQSGGHCTATSRNWLTFHLPH